MLDGDELREIGISQWGFLSTAQLEFCEEIRHVCEGNSCGLYNTSWACPPAVGTLEDCRNICLQFARAMVFNAVYPLADSFDWEGMLAGHREFKKVCDRLFDQVKKGAETVLLLSNEGCGRCRKCTYPEAPCRFPERLFPSVEGFGLYVNRLAEAAGIHYTNGENTVTYFGLLLF